MSKSQFPWRGFFLILLVSLIARILLLTSGAVSFHADEAVVGLMARHILAGERPTFFYGQAYMGSLDAWLIALGFRLLGDSVLSIRIVQSVLYMLVVASGYAMAWRVSGRVLVAVITGLLLAVPTVNTALYTTATLGGYNETLLFGTLILLLGYEVTHDHPASYWRWALLGLCAGLGWWTNGLIVVYALPVGLLVVYRLLRKRTIGAIGARRALSLLTIAAGCFLIGSAPWWVFDFTHDHAALSTYLTNRQSGEFAGIGIPYVPPLQRATGLVFIGLPALMGLRFPWAASYFLLPIGIIVVLVYGAAVYWLARGHNPLKSDARGLVLGMIGLFCVVFVASSFGADPTGRYFLPLQLPLAIVLAVFITTLYDSHMPDTASPTSFRPSLLSLRSLSFGLATLALLYQAAGVWYAASTPPGITTQFDLVSHLPNDHDDELIAFLDDKGLYNGYTNYWVAFRLAFLTDERMQYSAALPYKSNLDYNPADNRYPPYQVAAEAAETIAIITTHAPELDERLQARFAADGITYEEQQIGVFRIYYDFVPQAPRPPLYE